MIVWRMMVLVSSIHLLSVHDTALVAPIDMFDPSARLFGYAIT